MKGTTKRSGYQSEGELYGAPVVIPSKIQLLRRLLFMLAMFVGIGLLGFSLASEWPDAQSNAVSLRIDGPIGPATSDWVTRGFSEATERNAPFIVLQIDTPGGLDSAMRVIIKQILASPVPVISWVGPEGARAASAGTFILYASHVAAMAPATNLGAASPVAVGGTPGPFGRPMGDSGENPSGEDSASQDTRQNIESTADTATDNSTPSTARHPIRSGNTLMDKASSDAAAYIRSLAQLRERNEDFAERAVRDAASLSADEALKAGVIDLVAATMDDLLKALNGREVRLDSGDLVTLNTTGVAITQLTPDWQAQLLAIISNPQIALVLMMIGMYGLFFEFTSPGFGVPGVAGLICLLIAMYSFQMLPVNWAGVALMVLGAILMLAEAFAPSFGVLGIGGLIAFMVGGLFLFDGSAPGFSIPFTFLLTLGIVSAFTLAAIGGFAVKARKRRVVSGREELIGCIGQIISVDQHHAYAHLHGESWRVISKQPLVTGQQVRVTGLDGLTLNVDVVTSTEPTPMKPSGGNHVV